MKTRHPLRFKVYPYPYIIDIPAGTQLRRANNIPVDINGDHKYWTPARLVPKEIRAYGCLVTKDEALNGQ